MAEWGSADSYATRISDLTNGGGLNGSYLLSGAGSSSPTVHAGGADTLNGVQTNQSTALDWFLISALDSVNYFNKKTETETQIS
jgi:hypothetical protein